MELFDQIEKPEEQSGKQDEQLHERFRPGDKPPRGYGQVEDVTISDDRARSYTLRTEDGSREQLDKLSQDATGRVHQARIRLYDGSREAGSAEVSFEVEPRKLPGSDRYIADVRAYVSRIEVEQNYRGHDLGTRMLERADELARQAKAREIYGRPDPGTADFYEKAGFETRQNGGTIEFYKSYFFK